MAYAFNEMSNVNPKDALEGLTAEQREALANAIDNYDNIVGALRVGNSWAEVLDALSPQAIYDLGTALGYDMFPPNRDVYVKVNEHTLDARFRKDLLTNSALDHATRGGRDLTSLLYTGPPRDLIFRAMLPREAYFVYKAWDTGNQLETLREHLQ
jgi:hypothetical protein